MFDNKKFRYAMYYVFGAGIILMILNFVLVDFKTQSIKYNEFTKMLTEKKN